MSDDARLPVRETGARQVYDGRIVRLFEREVEFPGGRTVRLEIVHHPGAAAVVPLHEDGSVTLVHQYRHATGRFLYEIPAGLLEAGEAPLDCARRELEEETGLTADRVEPLLTYHTTPGFSDEQVHLFVATGLGEGRQALEHDELLETVRVPFGRALDWVREGRITDGKTLIALLAVHGALDEPYGGSEGAG
jgi:ADP-ribose pyrophosphatase